MKIYTSYWSHWRRWPKNAVAVSVDIKEPKRWAKKGVKEIRELIPEERVMREVAAWGCAVWMAEEVYKSKLRALARDEVREKLAAIGEGKDIILVRGKRKFDYAQLAAEWLDTDRPE